MLQNKKSKWANTDTRLGHNVFFKGKLNHRIALIELGGDDDLKNVIGLLDASSDLTGSKAEDKQNIHQLIGLIIRQPIDRKRGPI